MSLLNERWEELRVRAMTKQARLQQVLMELQQAQLDRLAEWLGDMEQRISQHGPVAADLDTIQTQVDTHKVSHVLSPRTFTSRTTTWVVIKFYLCDGFNEV